MPNLRRASSPRRSRLVSWGSRVALLVVMEAAHAPAAPPSPSATSERIIVLVRTPGDEAVMTHLRAELAGSDWRLLELRLDERQPRVSLAAIAEHERASAAVRFDERSGAIDVWVARPSGPIEETLATPGVPAQDQVLAVRVAEALRARGLALGPLEEPEPASEPEPVPVTRTEAMAATAAVDQGASPSDSPVASSHLWLGIGPGVAASPGGLSPLVVGLPHVRVELRRWSFSALGVFPLTRAELAGAEGRARIATWMLAGAVDFDWARSTALGVRSGVGAGAVVTTTSGEPAPGYRGAEDAVYSATTFFHSSVAVALGRSFRLSPSVLAGVTLPRARIAFGAREVARWGAPFAVLGVTLEAGAHHWD